MTNVPQNAREFALEIVHRLRAAGFEALWAGGCVRDQLLNLEPKDYDVATNATPDQIRELFGRRRTLAIGQAFGVICVLGSESVGMVEVATFRCDASYSDGRHPDHVTFSTAEEDALRRDFTINGLFYDPIEDRVIDYVGGREDLQRRLIRAIGDPHQRIEEDKLRMLRAVRFAATFGFEIEAATEAAVREHAPQLVVVSAERITAELRRMLEHDQRHIAVELLRRTNLVTIILPDWKPLLLQTELLTSSPFEQTLEILERLESVSFPVALAVLVRCLNVDGGNAQRINQIVSNLRLSNSEVRVLRFLSANETAIRQARQISWPRLQRILIQEDARELLDYCEAIASVVDGDTQQVEFCREKLALPTDLLNPPPLITGDDLRRRGLPRGPAYRTTLEAVRDAQLDGKVRTPEEAMELAMNLFDKDTK